MSDDRVSDAATRSRRRERRVASGSDHDVHRAPTRALIGYIVRFAGTGCSCRRCRSGPRRRCRAPRRTWDSANGRSGNRGRRIGIAGDDRARDVASHRQAVRGRRPLPVGPRGRGSNNPAYVRHPRNRRHATGVDADRDHADPIARHHHSRQCQRRRLRGRLQPTNCSPSSSAAAHPQQPPATATSGPAACDPPNVVPV